MAEQTYKDFELTILDDASTDDSLRMIEDFTHALPARVIVNSKNSGIPAHRKPTSLSVANICSRCRLEPSFVSRGRESITGWETPSLA